MSLAELTGGTPQRAQQDIEQVRELRRAIGYDAEHVVNVALLAWAGAPRAQVEMIAEGAASDGLRWGPGRRRSPRWRSVTWPRATTATPTTVSSRWSRTLPAGHPAAVPRLRRGRRAAAGTPTEAASYVAR